MAPISQESITSEAPINGHTNGIKPSFGHTQIPSHPTRSLQFLQKLKADNDHEVPVPLQAKVKLRVAIIGGGLGGLACAIALARRGHTVSVLEQAPQLGEVSYPMSPWKYIQLLTPTKVGAGIQIPSNSSRLLLSWGLGPFLDKAVVEPAGISFRRWEDGNVIGHTKLVPEFRENFNAPYYVIHRAHFHDALYRKALELGVHVRLASRVEKYDLDAPSVELSNAEVVTADLIVAADGE